MKKCPKCRYVFDAFDNFCPRCAENEAMNSPEADMEEEREEPLSPSSPPSHAQRLPLGVEPEQDSLDEVSGYLIKQEKHMGEILIGFEAKNKYEVKDKRNHLLFRVEETESSWLSTFLRIFLAALRPFTIRVADKMGKTVVWFKRPFRFYFHEVTILDTKSLPVGTVRRRFSFLRRLYVVYDESGQEVFELFGPILKPWTFLIQKDGHEIGKIVKKWSGLLKEAFTAADNFGADFPKELSSYHKELLLGATILIDFVHFEKRG